MRSASHQSRYMRHIDHQFGADLIGDLPHAGEINHAGVGTASADNHFGTLAYRDLLHLVIVDGFRIFTHAVRNDLVHLAGEVQRMPVREMASVGQIQTHHCVARLQQRHISGHIGLRTRMRLDIHMVRAKDLFGPVTCQSLDHISKLASAVIALAWITLSVLVGKDRACGLEHRHADKVLRGNQFQTIMLAVSFVPNSLGNLRIGFRHGTGHPVILHDNEILLEMRPRGWGC